jgi:hypothetical protein
LEDLRNTVNFVLETVSRISQIEGITVVRDYPAVIKDNPLTNIVVSYGISTLETSYHEEDNPGLAVTKIKVTFTIHAPLTYSGEDCHNVFVDIVELINDGEIFFIEYGCGNTEYNRNTSTLVLEGWGLYEEILGF